MKSFKSNTEIRTDIQVLRGLAVVAVILYHADSKFFSLGYLGVDIFFVISGYVIMPKIISIFQPNYQFELSKLIHFYRSRFYRIVPALVFALIFSVLLILFFGPPEYHSRIARQGISSMFFVGNFGALIYSGNYFSPDINPLIHMWSLAVEAQIYLLLPLLLAILYKIKIQPKVTIYLFLIISFMFYINPYISETFMSFIGYGGKSQASFYSSADRFWQFALGGILSTFPIISFSKYLNLNVVKILIPTSSVLLILIYHSNNKIESIIASLLTVLAISNLTFRSKKLRWISWIGDRSYSIYLFHLPILYVCKTSPATKIHGVENVFFQIILGITVSIILGSYSYSKIENKFRFHAFQNSNQRFNAFFIFVMYILCFILFFALDRFSMYELSHFNKQMNIASNPWDLDKKCFRMTNNGPPCEYFTNNFPKKVLLIGDSHAAQYSEAVVKAVNILNMGAVIWTQAGCPVQFVEGKSEQFPLSCLEMNSEKKKWIIKNRPEAIIVSYYMGTKYDQKLLLQALLEIRPYTSQILLIENNPIFPDGDRFNQQLPIIMRHYNAPRSFILSGMDTSSKVPANNLYRLVRSYGIKTLNVDSKFCDLDSCNRWLQGNWLYGDENHLSVAGANLIVPELVSFLKNID
jgi:peptidoglycan/LPS O-acetylase OafA/YrhL